MQDGRTEQKARWIMSSNRCQISFFHICREGVGEHQHIHTSGAFICRLGFCSCGTDLKICTLKGSKVKHFTPDRKERLRCRAHTHTAAQNSSLAGAVQLTNPFSCCRSVHTSVGLVRSRSVTMTNKPKQHVPHGNRPRPEVAPRQEALLFLMRSVTVEHIR